MTGTTAAAGNDVRLLAGELGVKAPVRAVHTSNINTANPATMTYGGIVCVAGDRVLLTGQSAPAQNGVWVVGATSGTALARATDMAAGSTIAGACLVPVSESTTTANVDSVWVCTTNDLAIVVGTDTQDWSLAGGADVQMKSRAETITGVKTYSQRPKHGVNAITATATIAATVGKLNTFAGSSGQTVTMPAAGVGDELEILNIDTADSLTITRAGSDTFTPPTNGSTLNSFTLPAGARMKFVCVVAGTWLLVPQAPIPKVAALPATPYDGMEVYFQTSTMATAGWMPFQLRYNAASASAYKWEAVGDSEFTSVATYVINSVSTTYATVGVSGPRHTIPLIGEWVVQGGARIGDAGGNAGLVGWWSYGMATGTGPNASDSLRSATGSLPAAETGKPQSVTTPKQVETITAVGDLQEYFRSGTAAQDARFTLRWLAIKPRRVA